MTCAQAISYFASNRVIYKRAIGSPLPIRIGVPIAERRKHQCVGRGNTWRGYWMKTIDNPRCVPLIHCG
jgi:hypothetical protein